MRLTLILAKAGGRLVRHFPEGVTTRLKTRQGMGCGVWGVGKIEAMQRLHAGVSPMSDCIKTGNLE
ncbi:MAG: hypothetical protein F6J98_15095 [Moorea sp. SIO4G2]|nr:hypothetical protein [Moorena sp. SIO4G2]